MVHKKYTYKKGKRFGPYYYETKRVNGKVVTTYLGSKNPEKKFKLNKNHFYFISGALLLVLLLFGINNIEKITGFVVGGNDSIGLDNNVSENLEVNESTEGDIEVNVTGANITGVSERNIEVNITEVNGTSVVDSGINLSVNLSVGNVSVETVQFEAVLNRPVKWVKRINISENDKNVSLKVELPLNAENISIKKLDLLEEDIEDSVGVDTDDEVEESEDVELNKTEIVGNDTGIGLNETIIVEVNVTEIVGNDTSGEDTAEEIESVDEEKEKEEKKKDKDKDKEIELELEDDEIEVNVSIDITGSVIVRGSEEGGDLEFVEWFKNLLRFTGFIVEAEEAIETQEIDVEVNELIDEVEIEYQTAAPYAEEKDIERGKRVKIVGPEDVHYSNVLAFAELNESFGVNSLKNIKIYWQENETYIKPERILDLNNNGIYDYVEWIAPELSNQTFDIIVITKAEHLDGDLTFLSDIFEEVSVLDGNWSETIKTGEYVRVTFEVPLDSTRDITIYPRVVGGSPRVEVYEFNKTDLIAEFVDVVDNEYNKVFLIGLNGSQDTFDLKILGGDLEFDHIIDPDPEQEYFENCGSIADWTLSPDGWEAAEGNYCKCQACSEGSNMTSVNINLGGENHANLTFDYNTSGFADGNYFKVYVSDGETYRAALNITVDKVDTLATIALEDYVSSLTSTVTLRGDCTSASGGRGADGICTWDNLNITSYDFSAPNISYQGDTPANASSQNYDSIVVNLTTSDNRPHYSFVDFNRDLLVWMRFDDNNGSDAFDNSTWGNNGTFVGTATINSSGYGAPYGDVLVIDQINRGGNEVVEISNFNISEETWPNGSISLWINYSAIHPNNYARIFSSELANNRGFSFRTGTPAQDRLDMRIYNAAGSSFASISNVANYSGGAGRWQHIVLTWDRYDSLKAYHNGTFIKQDTSINDVPVGDSVLSLGGRVYCCNDQNWDGLQIDDLIVFNRTLTADEVGALYNSSKNLYYRNFTGLGSANEDHIFKGYAVDKFANVNKSVGHRTVSIGDYIAPNVSYQGDTPANASSQGYDSIVVNLTTSDDNDHYSFVDKDRDLVLWMRMDDIINSTVVKDLSTRGNNATYIKGANINHSAIYGNRSVKIDHINGVFQRMDVKNFNMTDLAWPNGTISFWINHSADVPTANARIVSAERGINRGLIVYYDAANDEYRFSLWDKNGANIQLLQAGENSFSNTDHVWTHYVFTWRSGNNMTLYTNGTFAVEKGLAGTQADFGTNLTIGMISQGLDHDGNHIFYMDELIVFNRSLRAEEAAALYNASKNYYYHNFTSLKNKEHIFKGYAVDILGNINDSLGHRTVTISNVPNNATNIEINSTDGTNRTAQNLHVNATISDPDGGGLNVTVLWHNGTILHLVEYYNSSYANSSSFNATLNSGNTTKGENWTVGLISFDGTVNGSAVNSSFTVNISNTLPTVPTFSSPAHGSSTTDRTPTFDWSDSTDADSTDTITYDFNVTLNLKASTCADAPRHITDIDSSTHILAGELQCLKDNNDNYNWSVRAYDGTDYSAWVDPMFTINISSEIAISLRNATVEFGNIAQDGTNDTTDNSPWPLVIQNDGNVFVNVTLNATDLWNTVSSPAPNLQGKIDNVTETGENSSFNPSQSIIAFANLPSSLALAIAELNYTNASDSAEIDIKITVPSDEGSSIRSAILTFVASLGE